MERTSTCLELTPDEEGVLTPSRSVDPQAHDAYLRGLKLRGPQQRVEVWGPRAIDQYERAVKLDPNFAEAWAALAGDRVRLGISGANLRHRSEFPKAREAAQRALKIDNRMGSAHAVLGMVRLHHDWDFPGARRAFQRALRLSPSDPDALSGYAFFLLFVGEPKEEALDYSERLLRVAPLDLYWRGERVSHLFFARQYERALEEAERVRLLDSSFLHWYEAWSYVGLGQFEQAHRALIAVEIPCGAPCGWIKEALEHGWAKGGWEGSLREWLAVATNIEGYSPWMFASLYGRLGETEEAFDWLERAYRERDPLMITTKADPCFDSLRPDPRFHDLLRRIGFPED